MGLKRERRRNTKEEDEEEVKQWGFCDINILKLTLSPVLRQVKRQFSMKPASLLPSAAGIVSENFTLPLSAGMSANC
jgi:hypothetical protein